jgi:hypothetical protein
MAVEPLVEGNPGLFAASVANLTLVPGRFERLELNEVETAHLLRLLEVTLCLFPACATPPRIALAHCRGVQ